MPDRLTVREITFRVQVPGFRTDAITVVTTLLDPTAFPKHAFVQLYRRRWAAEIFLRDIKTTMGMDILRCKGPNMIHKELAGVRQWAPIMAAAGLGVKKRRHLLAALLECLAPDRLPNRPDRTEPRAVKRRPKDYQRLTGPRRLFKEAPHRNRYRKSLSQRHSGHDALPRLLTGLTRCEIECLESCESC